jgi:hypothetical protein
MNTLQTINAVVNIHENVSSLLAGMEISAKYSFRESNLKKLSLTCQGRFTDSPEYIGCNSVRYKTSDWPLLSLVFYPDWQLLHPTPNTHPCFISLCTNIGANSTLVESFLRDRRKAFNLCTRYPFVCTLLALQRSLLRILWT